MAKYRKVPVVVDARRCEVPETITTLEGTMRANPGDWIITGVAGEKYPCRDDIFRATYVAASDPVDLVPRVWCDCGDSIEPCDEALCGNCAFVLRAQRDSSQDKATQARRDLEQARIDTRKR